MPLQNIVLACVAIALAAPAAHAQRWLRSGDQLTLTIEHPAAVKASLDHIAFTQPEGPCSAEFSDALVADFATSGSIVIDRLHLKNLIAEHKLNVSGLINAKSAAKIGKLIGAGSLVFVKVHECKTYHTREANHTVDMKGNVNKDLVPTTRGTLKAAVQIVDLTTGVTIAARSIDAKVAVQARDSASFKERVLSTAASVRGGRGNSDAGDYPPDDQAFSALFIEAVTQVHRAMLPWTETKKIHFYNDRECGLNAAYNLLQAADYEGAAREALKAVEACEGNASVKPAQKARAHFNRAMTLVLLEDYLGAMRDFGHAIRLDGGNKVFAQAMQECNRAWSASQSSQVGGGKKPGAVTADKPLSGKDEKRPTALTVEERLKKLDDLRSKKMITEDEYVKKRKEILDSI